MKELYIAEDGTTFFTPQECLKYEAELRRKLTVNEVIAEFEHTCMAKSRSDEELAVYHMHIRNDEIPEIGDFYSGILYLRDDLVDILIKRIRELERALKEKE